MLCIFLLLFQLKLSATEDGRTAQLEFTASSNWVETNDTITLSCIVQAKNISDFTIEWHNTLTDEPFSEELHFTPFNSSLVTITYHLTPATSNLSGQYYCALLLDDGNISVSNNETLYVRDFIIDVENTVVYKDQQVVVSMRRYGDSTNLSCNFHPDVARGSCDSSPSSSDYTSSDYSTYSELCFTAEESVNITCSAAYDTCYYSNYTVCNVTNEEDGDPFQISKSLFIEVKVPEWSDWGDYSATCELHGNTSVTMETRDTGACVKVRNRTCVNDNAYSTCQGGVFGVRACNPDDCEPYVTSWGVWGACSLNTESTCNRARTRDCIAATNSTRTHCNDTLTEYRACQLEQCDSWTDWRAWSRCQATGSLCQQSRGRECTLVGVTCAGRYTETIGCDDMRCAPTFLTSQEIRIRKPYGEDFLLVCKVDASPVLGYNGMEIQWYRDSQLIVENKAFNEISNKYHTELNERKRGAYKCCVKNSFGKRCNDGWNVGLSDHGPVPTGSFGEVYEISLASNANFTMQCHLSGWKLEYKWFRGAPGSELISDATTQWYEIQHMSKDQQGTYSCCAYDGTSGSARSLCTTGYNISELENAQRKYLIITISVILLLILLLVLYIACAHTTKMNSFKRRFRHVFERSHTKLYNGLDPYGGGQVIQRSQSYLKRLSKSRPLSKSELTVVIEQLCEAPEPGDFPENAELGLEFDSVPNNSITINKTPVGTESKNRYLNVLPNQHSRVMLPELDKDPTSTYVNANYIRGYKLVPKEYVATQGPLPSTSCDFWRLVWEEKCRIIVMTTGLMENNRMKCSLYWPVAEEGITMKLGLFEIEQAGIFPSKYYSLSVMKLRKLKAEDSEETEESDDRIIYHMWYHSWPDFGVPDDTGPFLDFVECVRAFKSVLESVPVCVHCSAGIGRTGTFVAVNLGIEQFRDNGKVDPLGYICQLRQDRGGMIQTLDQYTFVYRALHAYQLRLAARDKESKDRLHINYGFYSLPEEYDLLPANLNLPVVVDLQGSSVEPNFIRSLTLQAMGAVPRYSDSITSINNLSIKGSTDSLNKDSSKPLLSNKSGAKQKRRSKVKSLFFPLSPKEKLKRTSTVSSTQDLRNIEPAHRSLSLNNVRFSMLSKSRESIASRDRVSVSSKGRSSLTSKDKVSVSPSSNSKERVSVCSRDRDRVSISSNRSSNTEVSIKLEN